jgi:Protein of unknown function (DUF2950)
MNTETRTRLYVLAALLILVTPRVWGQKPAQETFPTAEDAVVAMVDALKADDKQKLLSIFGPEVREIASSDNEAADRNGRDLFLAAYHERAPASGKFDQEDAAHWKRGMALPNPSGSGSQRVEIRDGAGSSRTSQPAHWAQRTRHNPHVLGVRRRAKGVRANGP